MRTSVKLCFTALTAALLLASAIATTSARNLSISNQQFRVTWQELDFATELVAITCHVTLEGSFHYRTIPKVERRLIGYITQVAVFRAPCRNGEAWAANGRETHPRLGVLANTLPWHVTYESFAGTLPNITSINLLLRGARFKIHSFLNTLCLYGDANDNITGRAIREARGAITTLEPVAGRNTARLVSSLGAGVCPPAGTFANRRPGVVTLLGTTTRLSVTLI